MNITPNAHQQPRSVPYKLYVDKRGILQNNEVGEDIGNIPKFEETIATSKSYLTGLTPREKADLKKDLTFKMFMGSKEYKDIVAVPFLRAFWGHLTEITDLTLLTEPLMPSAIDARGLEPDVVWQDSTTGATFLTEMQRRSQEFYPQRISLYEGKVRSTLAIKGGDWNHNQVPVFVLGLANFKLNRQGPADYLHEYVSMNPLDNADLLTNKDWKMLADLIKVKKVKPEEYTEQFKWLYLLNNFHKVKEMPPFMKEGNFAQVLNIAENLNRLKMEEVMDFIGELHRQDREREAVKKAKVEGLIEGKAEGKAEGQVDTIKKFLTNQSAGMNLNVSDIARAFGVKENLIKSLMPA